MNPNMTDATLIEHDNVKQFVLFMNSMEPELLTHNSCRWRITNSKEFVLAFRGKVNTIELNFGNGAIIQWAIRNNYTEECLSSGTITNWCDHDTCVQFITDLIAITDTEYTKESIGPVIDVLLDEA